MTNIRANSDKQRVIRHYLLGIASILCIAGRNEDEPVLASYRLFSWLACFDFLFVDFLIVILYRSHMRNASFFTNPTFDWQRRYEALRASFVDRQPAKVVADRFGFTPGYIRLLCHQFRTGKVDFSEPVPEGRPSVFFRGSPLRQHHT